MTARLSRRAFLVAAGAAGVGATAAWRLLAEDESSALGPMFDDLGAARTVGEAYLQRHPDEADERMLLASLGLGPGEASGADVRRLRAAVHADYERSRVVLVDGWYLSRTEARLCALCVYR